MTGADAARVAAARRWFRAQGYAPVTADGVTTVVTPAHPSTWDANWVQAEPNTGSATVFAALERYHPSGWQVVVVDALTSPNVEAALALSDFCAGVTLIEMAAVRVVSARPSPPFTLELVDTARWDRLAALVRADHAEGDGAGSRDAAVGAGLLDARRRRMGSCDYQLLVVDGVDVGYGMTAVCPNGLGVIENLFTLPTYRGRGLMSGFIVQATEQLMAAGCDAVFLDALADGAPKRLYARLGFAPVAVTRTWVRRA